MLILLVNRETKNLNTFTIDQLLEELNRDRSPDWSEYTLKSSLIEIIEAINDFTEYEAVGWTKSAVKEPN